MGISYGNYEATERKKREVVDNATFVACIQFYRSKEHAEGKYGNKDTTYKGTFGFDKFDAKVCAEGLIGEYEDLKTVMPKSPLFADIKKYLCAYLSIWPPNVEGNLDNSKSKVTLYVKAEEALTKLANNANIEFVCSDSNITINGSSTVNMILNGEAKPLMIECKGAFEKDVFIEAKVKGESKILGKLIIKANAVIYKTIIQPVEVSFGPTENFTLPAISHTAFIQSLVKDFNSKSFNQAYIYGELATNTKKISLNKSEFESKGLFSTKEDGNLYLKKESEDDPSTRTYNEKIEERYAASLIKGGLEKKKVEEKLKSSIKEVLKQFEKEYSFKNDVKHMLKQYQNKIVTKAWNNPKVQKAYQDYKIAKGNYDAMGGDSIGLDKTGKLHFFYSNDIHGAKNPESKVLAYSAISSGVAHIFQSAITSKDANSVILHELGHSLSLHHSFDREDLGTYSMKESGKRYKDEIENEIQSLEGNKKTGYLGEIKNLENDKKNIERNKKTNTNENEALTLSSLRVKYYTIQRCIDVKDSISILNFEDTFIKSVNLDSQSAIAIEANSLDIVSDKTSISISEIDVKINQAKEKLVQLEIEKKTAEEAKIYNKAKDLSKTQENYMDYYQDSNNNTNPNFERKSYYQWQWNNLQKTGMEKKFFEQQK